MHAGLENALPKIWFLIFLSCIFSRPYKMLCGCRVTSNFLLEVILSQQDIYEFSNMSFSDDDVVPRYAVSLYRRSAISIVQRATDPSIRRMVMAV